MTTPAEQLAQRILSGGLPMLAQYVAEVTLRLDEMAEDKPEPPTALDELRTIPGAACAHVESMRMVDRLQTELSEARAALARTRAELALVDAELWRELEYSGAEISRMHGELIKVTAERDDARRERDGMTDRFEAAQKRYLVAALSERELAKVTADR